MRVGIAKLKVVRGLDTVGVAGSTPVEPTISKLKIKQDIVIIPEDFDIIPGVTWENGQPHFYRTLVRKGCLGFEKGLKKSRSKKGA